MNKDHFANLENLDLYFKPRRCHLSFRQEYPQEIIFRNINIADVETLIITDPETEEASDQSELLTQYASFYELMMLSDDEYRFALARVFMKDNTIYIFDFNLSQIDCDLPDKLFQLASPVFTAYGYQLNEIRELIELAPMEHLSFESNIKRRLSNFDVDEIQF